MSLSYPPSCWPANYDRYAASPLHMIAKYDFKQPDILEILSDQFKVTPVLCKDRLEKLTTKLKIRQIISKPL